MRWGAGGSADRLLLFTIGGPGWERKAWEELWGRGLQRKVRTWDKGYTGLGFSKANQFSGPVLPLAVYKSTSTVGLPLESRISRAKIFCMAMAAGQRGLSVDSWSLKGTQNPLPFKSLPHPKKAGAGAKNIPQKGHRLKRQAQPPPPLRTGSISHVSPRSQWLTRYCRKGCCSSVCSWRGCWYTAQPAPGSKSLGSHYCWICNPAGTAERDERPI